MTTTASLTSKQRAHVGIEVAQGVAVLSENDQLLARGGCGRWDSAGPIRGRVFCHLIGDGRGRKNDAEQAGQLAPLAVLAAATHGTGERFEAPEGGDLGFQFVDSARGGRLVQDLCFSGFHLVVRGLLQILHVFIVQGGYGRSHHPDHGAPLQQLQLAATLLQAFTAAAQ